MGKLIAIEWLSLDGIFDTSLFAKWFFPFDSLERQQYIKETTMSNTAILYGRETYQELSAYWPDNVDPKLHEITRKLNNTPKFVVSTRLHESKWQNTTIISQDIFNKISELRQVKDQIIHINGSSKLVNSLINAELIDEIHLLIHPIVVGEGKRFFDEMSIPLLKFVSSEHINKGVLLTKYEVSPGEDR